jgi:hypothetical protein
MNGVRLLPEAIMQFGAKDDICSKLFHGISLWRIVDMSMYAFYARPAMGKE